MRTLHNAVAKRSRRLLSYKSAGLLAQILSGTPGFDSARIRITVGPPSDQRDARAAGETAR
ncbi:hypothetical protein I547_0047 [Mycobacterium kansasii 824]|uniref:Uncharacterized protein n=1 Tax=Mycobacterium kansasii TaxID=1768 RepID=A0A1V3XSL6_MYCKA|nr:hypothetical protein I547_0047 [Mycobacterium kansasii 824]OOK82169.1 hypothetical protein BZL30_0377 [Mycobacterium kansasii]OOK83541.1 hypothetical protein BZL29_1444 [Mycobacterium kansasii]